MKERETESLQGAAERAGQALLAGQASLAGQTSVAGRVWPARLRDLGLIAAALAIGWWAHGELAVKAASSDSNMQFQLDLRSHPDSLAIYSADDRAIYVYEGATIGNDSKPCTYKFQIGGPGEPIRRTNCAMGRLIP